MKTPTSEGKKKTAPDRIFGGKASHAERWEDINPDQIKAVSSAGMSVPNIDNIDFGDKNFSITFSRPDIPIKIYINKRFICPICRFEAEHNTNLEGEPENKPFCPECLRKANIPIMELAKKEGK